MIGDSFALCVDVPATNVRVTSVYLLIKSDSMFWAYLRYFMTWR